MNKINPPVEIYPSQLDAFKLKAKELASAISETYSIKKLSSFKRNDYLSIALGYKGHPDLIESAKFRQASDKETPLVLFLPSNIQNSIARVFSQKINELSENDILVVCKQLSWTEAKSIFPQTSIEDIKRASPEEVEAVLSNINSGIKLLMKESSSDDISQYGHVFESQVAEVDMMDVINDNPVTIVDTSNLDNKTLRKQLSVLFGGDLAKVAGKITMMAFEERKRLIRLNELEHPKQLTHVCSHKYHDSFHSEETGITDFHCLVCDHKWSENETLSQKPFKNFKRIAHGSYVGSFMLVFSPFRAPETKESKELEFSEREYILKNGGTITVEDPKLVATKKDWERTKETVANSTFYYFDPKKSNN